MEVIQIKWFPALNQFTGEGPFLTGLLAVGVCIEPLEVFDAGVSLREEILTKFCSAHGALLRSWISGSVVVVGHGLPDSGEVATGYGFHEVGVNAQTVSPVCSRLSFALIEA